MGNLLLQQGFDLLLFGMGTVFVFLTLLVLATILMSQIIKKYFAEMEPATATVNMAPVSDPYRPVDAKTLKIIQEAIHMHRANKG